MATSGSTSVTVTSWDTLKFSWSESSQSIANNTTTISWKMELVASSSGYISSTASKKWTVIVNGTTYSGTNTVGISNNTTKTLASGSTTISHNSDGTKSFSYSFSQQFSITFSNKSIGTISGSGTGTLDTIPRKSTMSVGNGTLGTSQTLTVTKQSSGFTHTITYACGSASGTICSKASGTSIAFTPPLSLANQNTNGTSLSITYTITTYNGNTSLGSNSYSKTLSIPASVKPSCSLSVSDAAGYASAYGGYIKGMSKFKVTVSATTSYGSAISKYSTTANGGTYTSASFTTGALTSSGTLTISSTVTDKRGRTGSASTNVSVLDYSQPMITKLKVNRCNADGAENPQGEYVIVSFGSTVTSLNNKNTATYTLSYKKSGDGSPANYIELTAYKNNFAVNNGSYVFPADTGSSYEITMAVADNFTNGSKSTPVSTAFTIMHWISTGFGMALGKIAELTGVLDIGFKTRFLGGILQPVLESGTDLNDVMTPNTYTLRSVDADRGNVYINSPVTGGTGVLEVISTGEDGQLRQRVIACNKTNPIKYERFYYSSSWGGWIQYGGPTVDNLTVNNTLTSKGNASVIGSLSLADSLVMENSKSLYMKDTGGTSRMVLKNTDSNWLSIGYGNYAAGNGGTDLYGNGISIYSKANITITSTGAGLSARAYGVNKVLWSGCQYMTENHVITLNEGIKAQPHGIVLAWSAYVSGKEQNYDWVYHFIPKQHVASFAGTGIDVTMFNADWTHAASKYLYVSNTTITGYNKNATDSSGSSVDYDNNYWVLRQVIGL